MEGQEKVKELVDKLRRITFIVQVAPFVYCGLYLIAIGLYLFAPDSVLKITDTFLYVSPITVLLCFSLSVSLRMCKWHKSACLLPLIPQIGLFIDRYVIEFGRMTVMIQLAMLGVMTASLLFFAYKVIFYGR